MFLLLYYFVSCFVIKPELEININSIVVKNDSTIVEIIIENKGKENICLYKPSLDDICYGIFKVFAYSINDTTAKYELLPSTTTIDLDSIYLNKENTIILLQDESFKTVIKFSNNKYSPFIKSGIYKMAIELNYKDVVFDSCFMNVFNENIKTNLMLFKIE